MGLSDEERLSGMYGAVHNLNQIKDQWENELSRDSYQMREHSKIRNLLGELWHAFIGQQSNSFHWFMGSSATNTITHEPTTPWEMAITGHLENAHRKIELDAMDEDSRSLHSRWEGREPAKFNALEYSDIPNLLRKGAHNGAVASYVYKTYMWLEQLLYYLRRYDDDFSHRYEAVSKLTSQILGECFTVFEQNENFGKAYVIKEILEILYGPNYPYSDDPDVIVQILQSQNLHHSFSSLMSAELKELIPHHIKLVRLQAKAQHLAESNGWSNNEELLKARLYTVLEFGTPIHQYEHVRKAVLAKVEGSSLKSEIPQLKKEMKRLADAFAQEKEKGQKSSSEDFRERALYAYGSFVGYDLMRDWLDESEVSESVVKSKQSKKLAKKPKNKSKKSKGK